MICPNCDKEIESKIEHCPNCGCHFPILSSSEFSLENTQFCKNCGKALSLSASFCKKCGAAVKDENN